MVQSKTGRALLVVGALIVLCFLGWGVWKWRNPPFSGDGALKTTNNDFPPLSHCYTMELYSIPISRRIICTRQFRGLPTANWFFSLAMRDIWGKATQPSGRVFVRTTLRDGGGTLVFDRGGYLNANDGWRVSDNGFTPNPGLTRQELDLANRTHYSLTIEIEASDDAIQDGCVVPIFGGCDYSFK